MADFTYMDIGGKFLGYGAPFVKAYSGNYTGIENNIVDFEYVYDNQEGDYCSIKLHFSNLGDKPFVEGEYKNRIYEADEAYLKTGAKWVITFGYLNGPTSTRIVYLFNDKVSYSKDGLEIDLVLKPRAAILNGVTSKATSQTTQEFINESSRNFGINTKTFLNDIAYNRAGNYQPASARDRTETSVAAFGFNRGIQPIVGINSEGRATLSLIGTEGDNLGTVQLQSNFNDILNTSVTFGRGTKDFGKRKITQGLGSDYKTIAESVNQESGGPYDIIRRDDDLIISKRDYSTAPIKVLKYMEHDGLLLSYIPESKGYGAGVAASVRTSYYEGETKTNFSEDVTPENLDNLTGNIVPTTLNPTFSSSRDNTETYVQSVGFRNEVNAIPKLNPETGELLIEIIDPEGKSLANVNAGRDFNKLLSTRVNFGRKYDSLIQNFRSKVSYLQGGEDQLKDFANAFMGDVTDEFDPEGNVARANALNQMMKQMEDKHPSEIETVGDPSLEAGRVVRMEGVAYVHSGNIYITQARHVINANNGYRTILTNARNAKFEVPPKATKKVIKKTITAEKAVKPKATTTPKITPVPQKTIDVRDINAVGLPIGVSLDGFLDGAYRLQATPQGTVEERFIQRGEFENTTVPNVTEYFEK
jgi:hypothetical protein